MHINIRSIGNNNVRLITTKSRVVPVQFITTPQPEHCSAVLLIQLKNSPSKYYTESNHIAKVQRLTEDHLRNRISGSNNPADMISRGTNFTELFHKTLW